MYISYFVYPFICWWTLVCYHFWLLGIILLYKYMFESQLSILLCIYPDVEFLDHMVILYLIFWGTNIVFPQGLHHFTFPPTMQNGSNFSTSLPTVFFFFPVLLIIGILMESHMVLIWIPLRTSDVKHSLIGLLAICISSLEKCLLKFFAHF